MKKNIWIDPECSFTLAIGEIGFVTNEPVVDGGPSRYCLRARALSDPDGQPVLRGHDGQTPGAIGIGLGRIVRRAKHSGRVCLELLAVTGELLGELGYPELTGQPHFLRDTWAAGSEPEEIQLLLTQLAEVAGLELTRPDGLPPTKGELRRAVAVAGSFHVALSELGSARETTGHGTLHDLATGEELRPATAEEEAHSIRAARLDGGHGIIEVDGRSCYVQ